jgi:MFS family permease
VAPVLALPANGAVARGVERAADEPVGGAGPPRPLRSLAAFFLAALARASEAFLLLLAAARGASPGALAAGWSLLHVLKWIAAAPAGRLADRIGVRRTLATGWLLHAAAFAGFAFAPGRLALALLLPLYALSVGLVEGSERALAVELGGERRAGAALGDYHAATGFGAAASSLAFGALWEATSPATAYLSAAAVAACAVPVLPRAEAARG